MNAVIKTPTSVPTVSNIIFDVVPISVGPDFSYNALTGVTTINTTGIYRLEYGVFVDTNQVNFPMPGEGEVEARINGNPLTQGEIGIPRTTPVGLELNIKEFSIECFFTANALDLLTIENQGTGPLPLVNGIFGDVVAYMVLEKVG